MTTNDHWVKAALTNDAMVAELLLRLKHHSSYSDSLNAPPPSTSVTHTKGFKLSYWGHRKNRSKPTATISNVKNGTGKEQRGSPTTHLSWSGGGGGSTSDGYDESSRPSDLSSGGRSVKANEGASTSGYSKSLKRKTFAELKDEEGSLLKERIYINKELTSMRVTLNQEMATSENLKRIKVTQTLNVIDFDQNRRAVDDEGKKKAQSCRVEAEEKKGFVLPDLNMMPNEEDEKEKRD